MLAGLAPKAGDLARVRGRVLDLLDGADPWNSRIMTRVLPRLHPAASDLSSWASWPMAPEPDLLAAARQNSPLESWLELLPAFEDLGTYSAGSQFRNRLPR